jgi:hypothetical protein
VHSTGDGFDPLRSQRQGLPVPCMAHLMVILHASLRCPEPHNALVQQHSFTLLLYLGIYLVTVVILNGFL